jgi:hypothetical protein
MSTITASTASLELARIAELEREVETLRVALAARAGIKEHIERYGNKKSYSPAPTPTAFGSLSTHCLTYTYLTSTWPRTIQHLPMKPCATT